MGMGYSADIYTVVVQGSGRPSIETSCSGSSR